MLPIREKVRSLLGRFIAGDGVAVALRGSVWLLADRLFRLLVGFFVFALVARELGPVDFGRLSYGLAIAGVLTALAGLGLEKIVLAKLSEAKSGIGVFRAAFGARMLCSLGCMAVWILVAFFLGGEDAAQSRVMLILAFSLPLQAFSSVDWLFLSQSKTGWLAVAQSLSFVLAAAVRIFLVKTHGAVEAFALVALGELAVAAIVKWIGVKNLVGGSVEVGIGLRGFGRLFSDSWPLWVSGFSVLVYMRADVLMVKHWAGTESVGIYEAAIKLTEFWLFLPHAIVSASYATLIVSLGKKAKPTPRMRGLFTLMGMLGIGVTITMLGVGEWLVGFVLGEQYLSSVPVMNVYLFSIVFVFLGHAQSVWNVKYGLQKIAMWRHLAGAALNISLNSLLIPRFGLNGAAWATVISYAVAHVFSNVMHFKTRSVFRMQVRGLLMLDVAQFFRGRSFR